MKLDFLCGTPNPVHFGREANLAPNLKTKLSAAVDPNQIANDIPYLELASRKKIRGIDSAFDHVAFLRAYVSALLDHLSEIDEINPKRVVDATFAALRVAVTETRPDLPHGSVLAFKQPHSTLKLDRLDWFLASWPEGKVIFMRRNPFGRLWSVIKYEEPERDLRLSANPRRFLQACLRVARDHRLAKSLESNERVLVVWYEALVLRTRYEVDRICSFLGIEPSGSMLTPTKLGVPATVVTNRSDAKAGIGQDSANKWKHHLQAGEKLVMSLVLAMVMARLDKEFPVKTVMMLVDKLTKLGRYGPDSVRPRMR